MHRVGRCLLPASTRQPVGLGGWTAGVRSFSTGHPRKLFPNRNFNVRSAAQPRLDPLVSNSTVQDKAKEPLSGMSLADVFTRGAVVTPQSLLSGAKFLYRELPVRLAKRVKELESLPYGLSNTEHVRRVHGWYVESFRDIIFGREPKTEEDERLFTERLRIILRRHANVVPTIAKGILDLKQELGDGVVFDCPFLQEFLDRFYMSRIGIRFLIAQHIALHENRPGFVGIIQENMSPFQVAEHAMEDARAICERNYGVAPFVNLHGDESLTFKYVPSHLHHILHELFKNSMRAVVEFHGPTAALPDIDVVIADGGNEVGFRITDRGGGIPRFQMSRIWTYLYTTAARPIDPEDAVNSNLTNAPMAGFGYGLPISRLFARYFGGDLQVSSMEGYGTDAFLHLNKLGDSAENLP